MTRWSRSRTSERPRSEVHPLEIPFVWFGIQFIEFAIVWLLISTFVPDDWPVVVPITLFFVLMVATRSPTTGSAAASSLGRRRPRSG